MAKKFHHIYLEITNRCNFSCSFCPKTHRPVGKMSLQQFDMVCDKIKAYTDMVYLHVMGEPLLHPDFASIVQTAHAHGLQIGLTTNAVYLSKHTSQLYDVRLNRVNVSLHSYYDVNNRVDKEQIEKSVMACDDLLAHTNATIFYRLWDMDHPKAMETIAYLREHYMCQEPIELLKTSPNGIGLCSRVRLQLEHIFVWPVNGSREDESGFCQGLRTHCAILCNGDVVPCCLDNDGTMVLGNIMEQSMEEILTSVRAINIYQQFTNRKLVEPLCKRCEYKMRFQKKA